MNLVNMSNGKSLHVPYRDSKLTFLLQVSKCNSYISKILYHFSEVRKLDFLKLFFVVILGKLAYH